MSDQDPTRRWPLVRDNVNVAVSDVQCSQLAEPLWTDPGIKSGIRVCELISSSKGNKWSNILKKFSQAMKKPSPGCSLNDFSVMSPIFGNKDVSLH